MNQLFFIKYALILKKIHLKYKEKMVGAALPFNSRGEERIESKDYKVKIIAHSEKSREEIFEELESKKFK
jgi:hypothetical protein